MNSRLIDKALAKISLTENSMAGNPPKCYLDQLVEITYTNDIVRGESYGRQPTKILWHGGQAAFFKNITNVSIISKTGEVLIDDDELCNFYQAPRDEGHYVEFYTLKADD